MLGLLKLLQVHWYTNVDNTQCVQDMHKHVLLHMISLATECFMASGERALFRKTQPSLLSLPPPRPLPGPSLATQPPLHLPGHTTPSTPPWPHTPAHLGSQAQ